MAVLLVVVVFVEVDGAEEVEDFELFVVLDVVFESGNDGSLAGLVLAEPAGFLDEVFVDFEVVGRGWAPSVWSMA